MKGQNVGGTLSRSTLTILRGYLREGCMATVHNVREPITCGTAKETDDRRDYGRVRLDEESKEQWDEICWRIIAAG